jgi:intracellular sulfur oxidation DsrE/DsrF family protein
MAGSSEARGVDHSGGENMLRNRLISLVFAGALVTFGWWQAASAGEPGSGKVKERVVLQVSDGDPKTWNQALNVIENLQQAYGQQNVEIRLVAFGAGLGILKLDSVAGSRVLDAVQSGAQILACENTMRRQKLTKDDMLPTIGYVPAGVVEIIERQRQGWAVIRP